ncbi:MAG: HEAT repeat domain-containing protein [Thermoguttaceae bacterium]
MTRSAVATAATVLGAAAVLAEEKPALDKAAIDKAFEALNTFDWGVDYTKYRELLGPIEDAVPATHGDASARKELETRLAAVLPTGASRAAKDFIGRKLAIIGTAESVPALAALLPDKDLSHMARYALERIPAPEAGKALCDALAKTSGAQKAGVIGSLGARRDAECVADLAALVGDSDAKIAVAAATALGDIGTVESAKALQDAKPASNRAKLRVADAQLTAGERLLAAGDKAGALAVYNALVASKPAKNILLAATRGRLLASGK